MLLPIALLGRTVALHNLSAYYMIPLLPFIALGGANFINKVSNFVWQQWMTEPGIRRTLTYSLVMLLIAVPLLMITLDTLDKVSTHYPTAIDPFLIDPGSARQAATFVNQHSAEDDLIIASPSVGWMLEGNIADFQMTVAYEGNETPHFPANVPKARFAFDPGIQQARFVVIDNLWDNWGAVHIPAVGTIQQTIETWPLVFEAGAIRVYENPSLAVHRAE